MSDPLDTTGGEPLRISVVIPTFNGLRRLRGTIQSVIEQSFAAHEIIVIDDGSTDETPCIADEYGDAIHYHRCTNGGQQRARNIGVGLATGNWIALLDHDDQWERDYLAEVNALVTQHDVDMTMCNSRTWQEAADQLSCSDDHRFTNHAPAGYWQRVGADPSDRFSVLERYDYASYLAYHPSQTSMVTIRRSLYDRLGGFDERMRGSGAENFEFELRALRVARVGLIWAPLVRMVRHDANASLDGSRMAMDVVECLRFAKAHHGLTAAEQLLVDREVQRRLPFALGGAYTLGDYRSVRDYRRAYRGQLHWKGELKAAIAALPGPLARHIGSLVRT